MNSCFTLNCYYIQIQQEYFTLDRSRRKKLIYHAFNFLVALFLSKLLEKYIGFRKNVDKENIAHILHFANLLSVIRSTFVYFFKTKYVK